MTDHHRRKVFDAQIRIMVLEGITRQLRQRKLCLGDVGIAVNAYVEKMPGNTNGDVSDARILFVIPTTPNAAHGSLLTEFHVYENAIGKIDGELGSRMPERAERAASTLADLTPEAIIFDRSHMFEPALIARKGKASSMHGASGERVAHHRCLDVRVRGTSGA